MTPEQEAAAAALRGIGQDMMVADSAHVRRQGRRVLDAVAVLTGGLTGAAQFPNAPLAFPDPPQARRRRKPCKS